MKAILAGLSQVDITTFEQAVEPDVSTANCYVLNENDQLTHLAIAKNSSIDLTKITEQRTLVALCCYQCNLDSLPDNIGQLTQLTYLDLSHNKLFYCLVIMG